MIISQDIKGGFVRVKRQGHYFNLISASGIVRVILQLNGSDVLRSDFWVGMSINDPIEYDTIIIQGDDAPVEFWASKVAMSNQGNINVVGASAIKTSNKAVLSKALIVDPSLTRSAVRLRSNKEVYLGGAAMNGDGWRLAAGVTEEIPLRGSLYAYKQLPELDISSAAIVNNYANLPAEQSSTSKGEVHVSDDNQTILVFNSSIFNDGHRFISTDGGVTFNAPSWDLDIEINIGASAKLLYHSARNELYMLVMQEDSRGGFRVFKSLDDGQTFNYITTANASTLVGTSYLNAQIKAHFIGDTLCFHVSNGWFGLMDLDTLQFSNCQRESNYVDQAVMDAVPELSSPATYNTLIQTSLSGDMVVSFSSPVKRTLHSSDYGRTFRIVLNDFLVINEGKDCHYLCGQNIYSTIYPHISTDYGATWEKITEHGSVKNRAFFQYLDDKWFQFSSSAINLWYKVGDQWQKETQSVSGVESKDGIALASGDILQLGDSLNRVKVAVSGDLSPAQVQIMELLS
ncbi:exo-alpha-sialidase [Shewanella sp. Scap07]|uniref:sialidase family protein n=1 Tax=Shewanella sp. Scap07 TaxID=2589987 RepID=UPI0015BAC8AD|nr:sialidase family protein [Shewanella sp. Scap07]QLE85565.1 exo-alpha-sialidase [Shewanella sp. Scap07]